MSLEKISTDVNAICQIDETIESGWKYSEKFKDFYFIDNPDKPFPKHLYPQFHTGLIGILLLNTFMINVMTNVYSDDSQLYINKDINQFSDITQHKSNGDSKKIFQQDISFLVKYYPKIKKQLKTLFKNVKKDSSSNKYDTGITKLRNFFMNRLAKQLIQEK